MQTLKDEHIRMLLDDMDRRHLSLRVEVMPDQEIIGLIKYYKTAGPTVTFTINGEVVLIGGISMYWEGMGEIWLFTTNLANDHKMGFTRLVYDWLHGMIKKEKLHRIQMVAEASDAQALKFGQFLGFSFETIMRKYSHKGTDCVLMSIVKESIQ